MYSVFYAYNNCDDMLDFLGSFKSFYDAEIIAMDYCHDNCDDFSVEEYLKYRVNKKNLN